MMMMTTVLPYALLSVIFSLFNLVSSACNKADNGLHYVDYKGECVVGGHEQFIKAYKHPGNIQGNKAMKTYDCKLCDTRNYLECYPKIINGNDGNGSSKSNSSSHLESKELQPQQQQPNNNAPGECDCVTSHINGYILVYDNGEKECRGAVNSTCDMKMVCHTGLKCDLGMCICESEEVGCNNVPKARLMPEVADSGASRDVFTCPGGTFTFVTIYAILYHNFLGSSE